MGYNLLKGKRGIITGALDENSIAWKVAEKAFGEGASFVLTNAPIAMRMGEINKLAEKTKSEIIPADATSVEELTNLFIKSQDVLGGKIDFVLHSIGMSVNIRKKNPYTEFAPLQSHFPDRCIRFHAKCRETAIGKSLHENAGGPAAAGRHDLYCSVCRCSRVGITSHKRRR